MVSEAVMSFVTGMKEHWTQVGVVPGLGMAQAMCFQRGDKRR